MYIGSYTGVEAWSNPLDFPRLAHVSIELADVHVGRCFHGGQSAVHLFLYFHELRKAHVVAFSRICTLWAYENRFMESQVCNSQVEDINRKRALEILNMHTHVLKAKTSKTFSCGQRI